MNDFTKEDSIPDRWAGQDTKKLSEEFGEKWFITFDNADGTHNGGLSSSPEGLIELIKYARLIGGKNIVIKDATPWHITEEPEI